MHPSWFLCMTIDGMLGASHKQQLLSVVTCCLLVTAAFISVRRILRGPRSRVLLTVCGFDGVRSSLKDQ